ncbi:DNA polymerase-3 subunit alpha (Gram-positive type) [Clostridium moniliforme]|uniref:DNA polymerase III PolC-type n=1 Tax=Clostridium moniliforme TaxID=39489 RepID=A0ABS4EWY5_9CLOT|nr:PolC-type DNA polymerase III [Clostridium moniliforme]MBP1888511.1 DNA polymerase-3 subunit alpha (Gram-positive type) [Clostridium moniliforme]
MSEEFIKRLNKEINKKENLEDKEIKLNRFQFYKKSNVLKVILKCKESLTESEEEFLKKLIVKNLGININVELLVYKDVEGASIKDILEKYWSDVVLNIVKKNPLSKNVLYSKHKDIDKDVIIIRYGSEAIVKHLKNKDIERKVSARIHDIFGVHVRIELKYDSLLEDNNYEENKAKENKKIVEDVLQGKIVQMNSSSSQENKEKKEKRETSSKNNKNEGYQKYKREPKGENTILGRNISQEAMKICDIDETSGYVAIIGEVFKTEIIETRTGKTILTFFITDYTSSITVKCFLKEKDKDEVLENVKKGLYCKVRGEAIYDTYAREVVIMGRDIVKMKKIERMDGSLEKRVELHLHTNMSTMDGMTSASRLIERAAKWGHEAIAITDHGVVQSFPDAQSASKKFGIKVLYGVEGYLVDDGIPIALHEKGETLDSSYVVFDLETTGFSPKNDKIIEIGAVKIENGKIIDRFSEFVNPKRNIPYKITELTGISDDMVKNSEDIETLLPKFLEFSKGSVLVAHNAAFDTGFIKGNCRRLGLDFDFTILDTVPLARFLYPELKKVKLNIVAKHLGISLENHHRAVDDAKATCDILLKCFEKLKEEKEIYDLKSLNDEFLSNFDIKRQPTYHIIILAKTQAGLKNLYKLVSEAHLENFFKSARTKKSKLQEMREGLIIGSACEAGELYRAILDGRSDEEITKVAEFYDYLEIQPIANNNFLIKKGNVEDEEELREINRKIYNIGKKLNKPVVATGDVHFLEPQDEAFRRIIMAGKGFKDADDQPPLYFKTTDEMLKEFSYLGEEEAKEVVITNPNKIASEVENIKPIPDETFPPKIEGAEDEIRNMVRKKVHSIYGENLPDVIQKRLDKELNSIINNGYAVLYLIAQKLVAKSLKDGYLVGSRGSVGSSFVATMSDITEVNGLPPHYVCPKCKNSEFFLDGSVSSGADLPPKKCPKCGADYKRDGHDIPFETFLGFEGDKEPDIDLNFSGEYQGVVHKYCEVLFGKGYVFKAGTIGTVAEKTAYGYVRKYLDERDIRVSSAEIERLTIGCTGIKRTTGQHPGGIMVVPSDNEIYNFTPIQHPADDNDTDIITTHFDYHSISGRLLKLDILGHDDPTVLRMLQDLTGLDPKTIPLNDEKVISLFTKPDALGVTKEELECEVGSYGLPEFGTKFVRQMLVDTKPKSFADLVRISGLSHGTDVWLNNAQYFIKEGYTTLKDCIATRDDIMVYLMHRGLPPKMAFTIMEKVRKGKGLSEEHEKLMREYNVPDWYIESCKRIKYMFPKGHAVAYVMMAVRIAYYKVYYPKAYYATYFTVRADDFDADLICKGEGAVYEKLHELYDLGNAATTKEKGMITSLEMAFEMYKRGFKFLKVDLYKSEATKFIIEGNGLRPPINALQGVGDNAAKSIVEARAFGEFISKEDLRLRAKITKTAVEMLDNHGCLEGLPETNQLSLF